MSTILIVDDETLARDALARLLEHEGFTTLRAPNGREAWAMMYQRPPDLILLDLMMPEMDGVTFLSMVRRNALTRDLPVVVLTGADDRDHLITKAWDLGVNDLVPKPDFTVADVVARIRQHLAEKGPARAPSWRGQSRFAGAAG
jgi:DNA-binding response OmpR family regulator